MGLGTAIFVIGLLYLLINYPGFRKTTIWVAVIAVVVTIIFLNK